MTTIQNTSDLLTFLVDQSDQRKDWFSWQQQKMTAIVLAHDIAKTHADLMTPAEIVTFVLSLQDEIFHRIVLPRQPK
jgi:hypothetical protein